jgi:nucleotide-binding universal stress UspA family protein
MPTTSESVMLKQLSDAYLAGTANSLSTTGLVVTTTVLAGDVVDAILNEVSRSGAELVVFSTCARSGDIRWRYEQLTDALLLQSSVPVLLVPQAAAHKWTDARAPRLLVALDGSTPSEAILPAAVMLAQLLATEIVLLEVVQPALGGQLVGDLTAQLENARVYVKKVVDQLRPTGLAVSVRVDLGRPPRVIGKLLVDEPFDVVATATCTQGETCAVVGTVADQVLENAEVPVLLVRAR